MLKNNLSKIPGEKRIKMHELQNLSGLGKDTIIRVYYNRTKNISFETIDKLCNALECNTQELFEHTQD